MLAGSQHHTLATWDNFLCCLYQATGLCPGPGQSPVARNPQNQGGIQSPTAAPCGGLSPPSTKHWPIEDGIIQLVPLDLLFLVLFFLMSPAQQGIS